MKRHMHTVLPLLFWETMKISLLQVNTVVGDLTGNADRIAAGVREASRYRPDLIVAPEALSDRLPAP